jgi:hypothetical protein
VKSNEALLTQETEIRTFKILRSDSIEPLIVRGWLLAEVIGSRYTIRVVQTVQDTYVLVLSDFWDNWQIVYQQPALAPLLTRLWSLGDGPSCPTVRALVTGQRDAPKVFQDLLEAVEEVICVLGGCE